MALPYYPIPVSDPEGLNHLNANLDYLNYNLGIGFKNKIINGGLKVWQRGGIFDINASTGNWIHTFTADRFKFGFNTASSARILVTKGEVSTGDKFPYARCQVVTSPSWSGIMVIHDFEIQDIWHLMGKPVTVSLDTRCLTGNIVWGALLDYVVNSIEADFITPTLIQNGITIPNATHDFIMKNAGVTLDASWKRGAITVVMPVLDESLVTDNYNKTCLRLYLLFEGTNDMSTFTHNAGYTAHLLPAGTVFDIANIQLEEGEVATAFEQRPLVLEAQMCMRYYEMISITGATLVCRNSSNVEVQVLYGKKRISPTIKYRGNFVVSNDAGTVVDLGQPEFTLMQTGTAPFGTSRLHFASLAGLTLATGKAFLVNDCLLEADAEF